MTSTTLAKDHALDKNDLQRDTNENKDYDCDNGSDGNRIKKKGRRLMSGNGEGIQDLLNTTVATTNPTMNIKGEMQIMTSSSPREEGEGHNISSRFINFCELHLICCNCIQLLYLSGSYNGSLSSWTAYTFAWQLRFGDVPDLLWLACRGGQGQVPSLHA